MKTINLVKLNVFPMNRYCGLLMPYNDAMRLQNYKIKNSDF